MSTSNIVEMPLVQIEPGRTREEWVEWFEEEKRKLRFRFPIIQEEDRLFWPDDYYERMEAWWASERRYLEPVEVFMMRKKVRLFDGFHRVAISHKIGLETIPVIFKT